MILSGILTLFQIDCQIAFASRKKFCLTVKSRNKPMAGLFSRKIIISIATL
jgi:hypothetical protein